MALPFAALQSLHTYEYFVDVPHMFEDNIVVYCLVLDALPVPAVVPDDAL
jgi:hypothetical protein